MILLKWTFSFRVTDEQKRSEFSKNIKAGLSSKNTSVMSCLLLKFGTLLSNGILLQSCLDFKMHGHTSIMFHLHIYADYSHQQGTSQMQNGVYKKIIFPFILLLLKAATPLWKVVLLF